MPSAYVFSVQVDPDSPPPVRFAASEMRRCLMRMTGENVRLIHSDRYEFDEPGRILIGTRDRFAGVLKASRCPAQDLDDEILITQVNGNTVVTGSNPRSVLFAVYDLLEQLGARWVGPGHLAEILPNSDCSELFGVEVSERASYRHRGVCIEGAPSLEHALGMVDWMAKRKMNTFFLQFKTSIYFWKNFYSREYNPDFGQAEEVDEEMSLELDREVIDAARLRGFNLHRVGHGWTSESIGHRGLGWWQTDRKPDESTRELLAEVRGRREFFGGTPINTELCYSNPMAFRGLVGEIVDYARDHPEVDCLHFWLSDATNNFCECESCRKRTPSDWYARLIKAVRREIRRENLKTRLVFLCYTNTLTPPRSESMPSGGLVFMFAPISRCYSHSLTDPSCRGIGKSGGWPLNSVRPPRTNAEYLEILESWSEAFRGDSFVFDYYLWQPYLRNLNPVGFARLINSDIASYEELGLGGLVSCQALRSFYPIGLPMAAMAETLWNREAEVSDIVEEQISLCFPSHGEEVKEYLLEVDRLISSRRGHRGPFEKGKFPGAAKLIEITGEFSGRIEKMKPENDVEERYLSLIFNFNHTLNLRCRAQLLLAGGKEKEAGDLLGEAGDFLRKTEDLTHRYLDLWLVLRSLHV